MVFGLESNGLDEVNKAEKIDYSLLSYQKLLNIFSRNRYVKKLSNLSEVKNIKIRNFRDIQSSIKSGFIIGEYNEQKIILINENNLYSIDYLLLEYTDYKKYLCNDRFFLEVIESCCKKTNIMIAEYRQRFLHPFTNAYIYNDFLSRFLVGSFIICCILCLYLFGILIYAANIVYFIQTSFKLSIFTISLFELKRGERIAVEYQHLPMYTILVPLYREASKVASIIYAIESLNYPKDKLDVKLILEEDDWLTIKAVQLVELAEYFHVIHTPSFGPRTKPKACNYAVSYAKGEFLVIYDAEDMPDKNQLLDAVAKFSELGPEYACLQARLQIKHKKYDLLGFLFKFEYDMLFSFLLKGLAKLNWPIPLGGTSNHFRVHLLRKIGLWDPYNVTEDADIGLRLSLMKYKVTILESITKEEASVSIIAWVKQRIRWIKGFIVTISLYLINDKSEQTFAQKFSIFVFIGLSILSFLLVPIVFISVLKYQDDNITILCELNISLFLVFFWFVAYFLSKNDSTNSGNYINYLAMVLFPFYFLLHTVAAYFALFEIMYSPFRWNKTDHGIY